MFFIFLVVWIFIGIFVFIVKKNKEFMYADILPNRHPITFLDYLMKRKRIDSAPFSVVNPNFKGL